jgi:hypothetical protein
MFNVCFEIEKETDKAVYVCTRMGCANNTTKHQWLPKSALKIDTYVATINPVTNEPETYGKRVVGIAEWLARKIRV